MNKPLLLSQVAEALNNSQDLLEESVLGAMLAKHIPWIALEAYTEREGLSNNIAVRLEIHILPESLPVTWSWKKDTYWVQRHSIAGNKFGPAAGHTNPEAVVLGVFESLARRFAPNFYEIDPRIGYTMQDSTFPVSPLFDPELQTAQHPSIAFNAYQRVTTWCKGDLNSRFRYPGLRNSQTDCVFCHQNVLAHEIPKEIVWGGGNIGWVHDDCAPWIEAYKPI